MRGRAVADGVIALLGTGLLVVGSFSALLAGQGRKQRLEPSLLPGPNQRGLMAAKQDPRSSMAN